APSEVIHVGLPTPEFFDALGVPALYGRTLSAVDANGPSGDPPAVLSYAFLRRRFNADAAAVGHPGLPPGQRVVIVGVMPAHFNPIAVDTSPDGRVPLRAYPLLADSDREPMEKWANFEVAGRLKLSTTLARAQAECLQIWRETTQEYYRNIWNLPQ